MIFLEGLKPPTSSCLKILDPTMLLVLVGLRHVEILYDIIYAIFTCRDSVVDITRYLANSCTSCWI
jgi:hypothetical protein